MIEVFTGLGVWNRLQARLPVGRVREAAIAYIGKGAANYLNMAGAQDVLIFDGSDASIAQNHVDLDEIEVMMDRDVSLYSRSGLHAKMMLIEDGKNAMALVGSANVSANSVEHLVEAVTLFDDPAAVDEVRLALLKYRTGQTALDRTWLAHVRQIPRHKRHPSSQWESDADRMPASTSERVWIIRFPLEDVDFSAQVNKIADRERQRTGAYVWPFELGDEEAALYKRVGVGDALMFKPTSAAGTTRINARIEEPGLVLKKADRVGPHRNILFLGYRDNARTERWDTVRDELLAVGDPCDADTLSSAGRDALLKLYEG